MRSDLFFKYKVGIKHYNYIIRISIIFAFFWFSNMILSHALILPVSHLETQQVMSLITSHIEYLIFNSCADFVVEIDGGF